ncbi:hypothetical protein AQUCO_78000001v1 [Aquilegia coerulea]|uniref:Mitochondrial glycoprotein n=1 Tax=Aquilegia coerulea TaxID=218851 RepID=A0A2G5C0A3_AQUCA|nr:hypothetical protein AQUCO_78000001v1 [Aquilegia coerulea]
MASLLRRTNQLSRFYSIATRKSTSCASVSSLLLKRDFVSSSNKTPTPTCPFHSSPCRCFSSSSSSSSINPSTPTCPIHSTSPCRCFSSSSSSSSVSVTKHPEVPSDVKLSQAIDSEIQYVKQENDDLDQGGLLPDGFPFEVIDNPGDQTITLKRELNGESIEVLVHMSVAGEHDQEDDDDDNKSDQVEISLTVTVTKGDGPRLEFTCIGYSEGITIEGMLMKGPEGSSKELPYEGPEFTDLDENLQREFHGYLERRGITMSLQNFLREYMMKKEGKEYVNWLKNMKEFVQN